MISRLGLGWARAGAAAAAITPAASTAAMRSEVVRVMLRSLLSGAEGIASLRRRGELHERRLRFLVRRHVVGRRRAGRAERLEVTIDRPRVAIAHVAHV